MLSGRPPSLNSTLTSCLTAWPRGSARQKRSTAAALEKAADELSGKASEALRATPGMVMTGEPAGSFRFFSAIIQKPSPPFLRPARDGSTRLLPLALTSAPCSWHCCRKTSKKLIVSPAAFCVNSPGIKPCNAATSTSVRSLGCRPWISHPGPVVDCLLPGTLWIHGAVALAECS